MKDSFRSELIQIALPVTAQSLLQSSFSVADQIMTGQLGSSCVAGIGLGGRFASIFSVVVAAVASVCGIMIAQNLGKKDERGVRKSIFTNMMTAMVVVVVFLILSLGLPNQVMSLYSDDKATIAVAVTYLRIYAISFLPAGITAILCTYLRCADAAKLTMYSGLCGAVLNTCLNYVLIFGKFGIPAMGYEGAAFASAISQVVMCLLVVVFFFRKYEQRTVREEEAVRQEKIRVTRSDLKLYAGILAPILVCEFFWSLGENVYCGIYGHISTEAFAAMALTSAIQLLVTGMLSGVSQAAGIMAGKRLGADQWDEAYDISKRLIRIGLAGALFMSLCVASLSGLYVKLFQVEDTVREITRQLLIVYSFFIPIKIENMIFGGGILRSGGRTKYVMVIDLIGTWLVGVPLGLLAANVCKLSMPMVYMVLSLEECVRLIISLIIFKRRNWMQSL